MPGFTRLSGVVSLLLLLTVHSVLSAPPAIPRRADAAEIERLIAQLGSDKFKERQAATRRLSEIGYPALPALRRAIAANTDLQIRRRSELLVEEIENTLEALTEDYKAFGLPLFSGNVTLVRYKLEKYPDRDSLGFLVRFPGLSTIPLLQRGGFFHVVDSSGQYLPVAPEKLTPAQVRQLVKELYLSREDAITAAIQSRAAGHEYLARTLFAGVVQKEGKGPPKAELARYAWGYWAYQRTSSDIDLRLIAKQMRTLLAADRRLREDARNREQLRLLELTLKPSRAAPGSVEALIDGLVNVRDEHLQFLLDGAIDSAYLRLLEKGLQAVPALIEHSDDQRLTRSSRWLPPGRFLDCQVGNLAWNLVTELAGQNDSDDWPDPFQEPQAAKAKAKAWLETAKKIGEEAYFVDRVLQSKPGHPNEHILRVLCKKYPHRLPDIYRRLLADYPGFVGWPVVDAIRISSLSAQKKRELFLRGARHKDLEHCRAALSGLEDLDPQQFEEILLVTLESLPQEPDVISAAAALAGYAATTRSPRLWKAIEGTAKRADPELRIEILARVCGGDLGGGKRNRCIALLTRFLDDRTTRDITKKANEDKIGLGTSQSNFLRLEVRNLAALYLAGILKIEASPKPDWSPEQWAKLRAKVRKALPR